MFWCAIAFVFGVTAYFHQPFAILAFWSVILFLVGLGLISRLQPTRLAGAFLLGVAYASLNTSVAGNRLPASLEGRDLRVRGIVTDLPLHDSRKQRFHFLIQSVEIDGQAFETRPLPVRLNWYGEQAPRIESAQRLEIVVKLKPARGFANPGAFDFEKWLFQRRIVATGYVRDRKFDPQTAILQRASHWRLGAWRSRLKDRLLAATEGLQNRAVIIALALGDRSGMEPDHWRRYIDTGTNHLLAISGLHISLVAGFAGWLAAAVWQRNRRIRRFTRTGCAASAGLLAALCYAAMAGFSLPTQRALIMLAVLAIALLWARHLRRSSGFALALIAVCLWDPRTALGAGLWLSFAAVAILMVVFSGERRARPHNHLLAVVRSHLLITLGLAPLTLLLFGQMSLVAPIANLIAVPIVGFVIVPAVFVTSLLATLSVGVARLLFGLVDWLLSGLGWLLDWLAALPLSVLTRGTFSTLQLLFAVSAVVLALLPQFWRLRWLVVPLLAAALFGAPGVRPADGEFELIFLDVGQGSALVVLTRKSAVVYDTGPGFSDSFNGASIGIIPLLKQRQIRRVHSLVLSHPDADHVGGAAHLLSEMAIDRVLGSAPVTSIDEPVADCADEPPWQLDGVTFEFLAPQRGQSGSENDRSCVLAIRSASGASALLAGDIERDGEQRLLAAGLSSFQVLMAPHHGSQTSSTEAFVLAVRPEHVVYTTGYANRFGFPAIDVRARYQAIAAREHNTARDGAVSFVSADGTFVWTNHRREHRHIWSSLERESSSQ